MTPKEKANQLIIRFIKHSRAEKNLKPIDSAKECSLIAVDEILNHHSQEQGLYRIDTYYWQEVKQEIEKL